MTTLGVILARAGSKGLPDKCVRELLGRPVITFTFDHAKASARLSSAVLTTDSEPAKRLARVAGIEVIDRPAVLADDRATVDAAARHAVETWEQRHGGHVDVVVLLYGNIPVRADGVIDRCITHLIDSGADSVRTVAPVSKQHPDWIHRLEGDTMRQFRPNCIYRRQDLEPLFYHDGAVAVVRRSALFAALKTPDDHQSFLGTDRRGMVQRPDDAVDIDEPIDFYLAEAVLRARSNSSREQATAIDLRIGNRAVGTQQPVYVVAEAGVNHNGSLSKAKELVEAAVRAGADAVKFQAFRAEELVTVSAPTARYQERAGKTGGQLDLLRGLELSKEAFAELRQHCKAMGIEFLATPFTESDLDRLLALGISAIKLASTDLTNLPLVRRAARSGKPVLLSTGASTAEEIGAAVGEFRAAGAMSRLLLMHCVSSYPTPLDAANLAAIRTLAALYQVPVGYSDHTTSIEAGGWAVAAGACLVEKHFTLDRTQPGPDHAMSLTPDELAAYVAAAKNARSAMGDGRMGMQPIEEEVRRVASKSVVAARMISSGTRITREMLTIKRPGGGVAPGQIEQLVGRVAKSVIAKDSLVAWEMVADG